MKSKTTSLVGHFFHSLGTESNEVQWQGSVIGNPEPGWYLIQLFGWIDGSPSVRKLVRIEDIQGWLFYGSSEEMIYSYDHGVARLGGPYRPTKSQ